MSRNRLNENQQAAIFIIFAVCVIVASFVITIQSHPNVLGLSTSTNSIVTK